MIYKELLVRLFSTCVRVSCNAVRENLSVRESRQSNSLELLRVFFCFTAAKSILRILK